MRYSLVSRFRGTMLGALLGESLASANEKQQKNCLDWKKMAILGTESLIELGRFDLVDWQRRQQQTGIILETSGYISPQVILATLPVALFFHENTILLRQNLLKAVKICQDDQLVQDWTLALGYAIAQSLTEKLSSATLIPQITSFLGKTPTNVPHILVKLNNLLAKQAGLEKIQAEMSREEKLSYTMAMAFYCFVDTTEDFRLSVLRATRVSSHSLFISAITGALSGAYNGTLGIPVSWRFLHPKAGSAEWLQSNFSLMLKLADALVATWSGVYPPALHPSGEVRQEESAIGLSATSPQAIAAPRVIRQR